MDKPTSHKDVIEPGKKIPWENLLKAMKVFEKKPRCRVMYAHGRWFYRYYWQSEGMTINQSNPFGRNWFWHEFPEIK